MIYTSRIVGVGNYEGKPLVTFTLASKSIPFRELRINHEKSRINVYSKKGFENHQTNQDPEVDNYSCIRTGVTKLGERFMVTFNGHMCKRVTSNLVDGINPLTSLDLTLLAFRGAPNDARIGGISFFNKEGKNSYYLGVNDVDRGEKRICSYPNFRIKELENRIAYIYDRDTNFEKVYDLVIPGLSTQELANNIHNNIVGQEIKFGLATGVAIMNQEKFEFGVFNNNFDEETIKRWSA
ncbi:MAG: IMP cyclohydrolase [Nanoarchaeota archaeon]